MRIPKNVSVIQTTLQGISKNNVIFLVLLFLQNMVIFWDHYFGNAGFPGDFMKTYYAISSFWTTAVNMGIFPEWVPYEAMGYPLAINAQSGLYYPVFWIFAILHIPFTLYLAVILQALHVLFGAIGMFLLLNSIFKSYRYAFVGAVAFQFFGGFFSNAQHTDIIRAFAMAPWLFYVFKLNTEDPKRITKQNLLIPIFKLNTEDPKRITKQNLLIPIVIYFAATGAYPGNFISVLFIMPIFLSLQLIDNYLRRGAYRGLLKTGGIMVGLLILGVLISAIHLGPIWQTGNEISRFTSYKVMNPFAFQYLPTLFMSNRLVANVQYDNIFTDISMTSIFVTLPILIFACFISISTVKKYWVFITVMILSFLMMVGPHLPFWQIITSAIPALGLSRFPSSDYRVFVAIPIFILGLAGLERIIERRVLSWKEFSARAAFVFVWFSVGTFSLYWNAFSAVQKILKAPKQPSQVFVNYEVVLAVIILAATVSLVVYYLRNSKAVFSDNKSTALSKSALIIVILLISADGFRVISDMQIYQWKNIPLNDYYKIHNVPLVKNGKLITYNIFENIPNERPARQTSESLLHLKGEKVNDPTFFAWLGYLNGSYMMADYGGTKLLSRLAVESNNVYKQYMLMKWTPILLDRNFDMSSESKVTLPRSIFSDILMQHNQTELCSKFTCGHSFSNNTLTNTNNQVLQTRYGINDIIYEVALKQPKLMVENEIYFPGWKADLLFPDKQVKLEPLVVNGIFRSWFLPSGHYKMIAHFHFPNLLIYQSISIVSFAIWIFVIMKYWRKQAASNNQSMRKKESSSGRWRWNLLRR